jgi:hypothetical protein
MAYLYLTSLFPAHFILVMDARPDSIAPFQSLDKLTSVILENVVQFLRLII